MRYIVYLTLHPLGSLSAYYISKLSSVVEINFVAAPKESTATQAL